MKKTWSLFAIGLSLIFAGDHALSEPSGTIDAEALLNLAPRISLEEKTISTFEIKGTFDVRGVKLRFMVSGKQPDQLELRVLDPRDKTPVMAGLGDSFMLYDPVSSDVTIGRATSIFTLGVEKDTEKASEANPDAKKVVMYFGVDSKKDTSKLTIVNIHSLLAALITPLDVQTKDNTSFVLSGVTKKGSKVKAYITPSRKEGPYTRVELYQAGNDKPFIVLDEIILNQPLAATRFVFPREKLLASALPTKQLSGNELDNTILSVGMLVRGIMARLVLAGADDSNFKSGVEKMSMRSLNWDEMKKNDAKNGAILRSIFQDDPPQPTQKEETIQKKKSPGKK
jgi:hypothetical protein